MIRVRHVTFREFYWGRSSDAKVKMSQLEFYLGLGTPYVPRKELVEVKSGEGRIQRF